VALDDNLICGDAHMVVARLNWDSDDDSYERPTWYDEERDYIRMWRKLFGS
jgi:hypothetical protein